MVGEEEEDRWTDRWTSGRDKVTGKSTVVGVTGERYTGESYSGCCTGMVETRNRIQQWREKRGVRKLNA